MSKLVPVNTWTPVPGCAPAGGPSIADSVTITGSPGEVASFQNGLKVWSLVLFDTPDDFRIDRYDATGAFIDSPITISRATGVITLHGRAMLSANPADPLEAATKAYVDAVSNTLATISDTAPASPLVGALWFDSTQAQMYVWFDDGSSQQWVPIVNQLNNAGGGSGPGPGAPVNTLGPVVTGTATAGSTLTTTNGTWSGTAPIYTYQWTRNGSPISGATSQTYVLTSADASTSIACSVTATNSGGSASALSNSISVLPTAPVNSAAPVVSGSTSIGSTLTTTNGTWSGGPTFTYQWQHGVTNISGATAATYVLTSTDASQSVSCIVTATNAAGSASAASNALTIPAFSFPGTPLAVYSMRLAGASYAGPCLQVIRVSDGHTQDIGFVGGAGSFVDFASAATYCAPEPPYVSKLYDQSGSGNHLAQGAGGLPQLMVINGVPMLTFTSQWTSDLKTAGALALTGDQTLGVVGAVMDDISCAPLSQSASSDGWALFFNGIGTNNTSGPNPGALAYFTGGGGGITVQDTGRYVAHFSRYATKRASGTGTLYVNGVSTKTASAPNGTTSASVILGSYQDGGGYNFNGVMVEIYIYNSALTDATRLSIDGNQAAFWADPQFNVPYSGTSAVAIGQNENINCGNVLNYERTNTWTAFVAFQMYANARIQANHGQEWAILYTNVPGSGTAFPGHEFIVNWAGHIAVRIINNASTSNWIDLEGTTVLFDGKKHAVAFSYDGSSTAAGVKVYVDGVPETMTVHSNGLSGSIVGSGQSLMIGMQQADPQYCLPGVISFVQFDNVVRSASYIATNFNNGAIPPIVGGTTDLALLLNDGSGATATDSSGHSRNGTLTSAGMWVV